MPLRDSRAGLRAARARQQGSVVVTAAIALSLLVIVFVGTELGMLFFQKRELQKAADLAALAGAQRVDATCQAAKQVALGSANGTGPQDASRNLPRDFMLSADGVECGLWSPQSGESDRFTPASDAGNNAVRVRISATPLALFTFFEGNRTIRVSAVAAREEPLAVFSVGTTLVSVGCNQQLAPLIQLLKVVGVGDPCATVGGYAGLVGAQVSASGLLKALGVPLTADMTILDVNELLSARKVTLGELLDTALQLGGQSELLGLNAELLRLLQTQLGIDALNLEIPLGTGPGGPGIFAAIHAPEATLASALDVQVNVLDIVTAAVGVGTTGSGIHIPGLQVAVPGILPNLLRVQAGIIEPPSIGIGGVGATAYNAQVRLYADVDTSGGVLGGLLQLLGTRVKLPIFIDVARAKGTIEEISCQAPVQDSTMAIRVDSSIANACIGRVAGDPFSVHTPICESLQNETLINVLGLVRVHNKINVDALQESYRSPDMKAGDSWQTPGNSLNLGSTLSGLVDELLRLLGEQLGAPTDGTWTPAENEASAKTMADYYLGLSSPQDPRGAIPKNQYLGDGVLGLGRGPQGVYDVPLLRDRLKTDIDRVSQSCFLLPFLCWQNNEWDHWANDIESANVGSGRACWGSTPEGFVTAGIGGTAADVARFNRCVERELKEAMLEEPASSRPNFLQVLLSPLMALLEAVLDPLGNLLAGPILRDTLGIELGKNDVNVTSVGCGNSKLVY